MRTRLRVETLEDRTLLSGGLPYPSVSTTDQLIADINYANSNSGAYTVSMGVSTLEFTSADNNTNGYNALPAITGNITIVGNGNSTIEANNTNDVANLTLPFRLFDVTNGGNLNLQNLTLSGGLTGYFGAIGASARGGAIYSSGTLSLNGVRVSGNEAIGNHGANYSATGNVAGSPKNGGDGGAAYGGGIYVAGGIVTISSSTFTNNVAQGGFGGGGQNGNVSHNSNKGGTGGSGGAAYGGGLCVATGNITLNGDSFGTNQALGGNGGIGFTSSAGPGGGDGGPGGQGAGGGIYVAGGSVTLSGLKSGFDNNEALGGNGGKAGGNTGNGANGGAGGGGYGGFLFVALGGTVTVTGSEATFSQNIAQGGNGGNGSNSVNLLVIIGGGGKGGSGGAGGVGYGGLLYDGGGGTVTLSNSALTYNEAVGGNGGNGGNGKGSSKAISCTGGGSSAGGAGSGGGLYLASDSVTLNLSNDRLSNNTAVGGNGGNGGNDNSSSGVAPGGRGSDGAAGSGGFLFLEGGGLVNLEDDTLSSNEAQGGKGGHGGQGFTAQDAGDGTGGNGLGGGLFVYGGTVQLTNDTLSSNKAVGGKGGGGYFLSAAGARLTTNFPVAGHGTGGNGMGGGLYVGAGVVQRLYSDTISGNQATGGEGGGSIQATARFNNEFLPGSGTGGNGMGGGLFVGSSSALTLANALIAKNEATAGQGSGKGATNGGSSGSASDPDVSGTVSSSDHDLIGDGTGSNLSNGTNGDLVGTSASPIDPLLGSLQYNGGSTLTEALQPGSPAIDAGDSSASDVPSTDQRGDTRILGNAVDIGAVEYQYDLAITGSGPSVVVAGGTQTLVYSITVQNNGPDTAGNDDGVQLIDGLPTGVTSLSFSAPSGWTTSYQNGKFTATISTLAAGASANFTLTAQMNVGNLSSGTIIANGARIDPYTWDTKTSNNEVTMDSTVFTLNDVSSPEKLAAAINYANSAGQPTTITLVKGTTFDFTSANNFTNGANALPVITGNVTLLGNNDTIERTGSNAFRFFDVTSGGSLTLNNLTLQGGLAQGTGAAAAGGAIYSSGTLSLNSVTIQSNKALGGDGVHGRNVGVGSGGPGSNGGSGAGGGLFIAAGVATLSDDILSGNQAQGGIGGAGGNGGNSSPNDFGGTGGAGGDGTGGGMCVVGGSVTMLHDTLSANEAQGGAGGMGGNDTTDGSGNTGGAGGSGAGGGLYVAGGTVSLTSETLGSNQAQGGNGGNGGNGAFFGGAGGTGGNATGGGLYVQSDITVGYYNATISGNTVTPGEGGSHGVGQLIRSDGAPGTTSFADMAANSSGFGNFNTESAQSITFPSLPDKTYGNADFALSATASSGLSVSYTASGKATVYQDTSGNWFAHITGAGTAMITASQAGNGTYLPAPNQSRTFSIAKATPRVSPPNNVPGNAFYNGQPQGVTVGDDVTGVKGEDLGAPTLIYYAGTYTLATLPNSGGSTTAPTDAGNYTAVDSFAGNTDYTSARALATYTIAKDTAIMPELLVPGSGYTYNGQSQGPGQPQSPTVGDVMGKNSHADLGAPTLTYYAGTYTLATLPSSGGSTTAPTDAGSYTAVGSYAGNNNYTSGSSLATFTIAKATPTVPKPVVSSENEYDGQPKAATVGDVIGVNNEDLGQPTLTYYTGTYTLATLPNSGGSSSPPTGSGNYTVVASYAGNTNYTSARSLTTYGIDQVSPTVSVSDAGGPNNGNPYPATATAVGVDGTTPVSGSFTLVYFAGTDTSGTSLGSKPPASAGTYTVLAVFTSADPNYTYGVAQTTFTITPVTSSPQAPPPPLSLNAPPLLVLLDLIWGGAETVNADGTATITDSVFGIPLLVAKFDNAGNVTSITLFGIDVTFLFTLLG
jgi:uncharacterized repeat protein (TIGR01451 family)